MRHEEEDSKEQHGISIHDITNSQEESKVDNGKFKNIGQLKDYI